MRALAITFLSLLLTNAASASRSYVRIGGGFERSDDTTLTDRRCDAATPPALFGCGTGNDGAPLAARGGFGNTVAWELAAGAELTSRFRVELAVAHRGNLGLDAQANFLGVTAEQPVRASAQATSAILAGSVDIGRFFVSAGAGLSRNELGTVTFSFPGIAADAATITRGGAHTAFAWTAGVGTSIPLTDRLLVDVGLRYTDLGTFRTRDGHATIIRPVRTFELDIAGTKAKASTVGASVSLRWRL